MLFQYLFRNKWCSKMDILYFNIIRIYFFIQIDTTEILFFKIFKYFFLE